MTWAAPISADLTATANAPVLVLAADPRRRDELAALVEGSGHRVALAETDTPVAMLERLDQQARASAVWIEFDRDAPGIDELARRLDRDAADGLYAAVVSAPVTLVDPLAAAMPLGEAQLLVAPSSLDRAAALALALAERGRPAALHDVTHETTTVRLKQLSDEVQRIAATLSRLSTGEVAAPTSVEKPAGPTGDAPQVSGEKVRAVIRARRQRGRFFDAELFADPAWDMLLDLFQAEIAQHRVPVSSLCIASAVPATTALRWIKTLTDAGHFVRRPDPHDGRRVFIELAPDTSLAMRRYFAEVGSSLPV